MIVVPNSFSFGPSFEEQERGLTSTTGIPKELEKTFEFLLRGTVISKDEASYIIHPLMHGDYFRVCADFEDYCRVQAEMEEVWKNQEEWTRRSILTVAGMGKFSSDHAYPFL